MERVFVHYRLKSGVTPAQYEAFAKNLDQKITTHQPGVIKFETHIIDYAEDSNGELEGPPVEVVETLDVSGWEAWQEVMASDAMAPVRAGFAEVADSDSVVSWRGHAL